MTFNLFNRLILWLKKIFHIRPEPKYEKKELVTKVLTEKKAVEIAQPLEEKSIEVAPSTFKQKREIDLGGTERKRLKSTKQAQQTAKVSIEKTETEPKGKEITKNNRVRS